MRIIYTSIISCLLFLGAIAQTPHPLIQQMLNEMSNDSLLNRVNELSGEKSCKVKGTQVTIKNRVSKNGNDLAADYLKEKMQSFGFTVSEQKYSTGGRNVFAEQKGSAYPDKKYMICAHYDAMADYCADDDASGCSAVLETARILSHYKFKYTIVYAFWDEEEQGLIGSAYYAKQAKANNENILGVFNIDMMAYDSDNDFKFDLHTKSTSLTLSDKIVELNNTYSFKLKPNVMNPGTDRSDHGSFWKNNYSAICFGEAYFSGDPNPQYHKSTDRVSLFNLPYYYALCRLGLATTATFAEPEGKVGVNPISNQSITIQIYPNPATHSTTIQYSLTVPAAVQMSLRDVQGRELLQFADDKKTIGSYQLNINTSEFPAGIYLLLTKLNNAPTPMQKLIVVK